MKRIPSVVALLSLLILAGVWPNPGLCQDKQLNFKLCHSVATDHPYHLGALRFAELVARRTDDKVKIEVYPSAQLGGERDTVEGLQLGTVDLVVTSTGPVGGFVPGMFVVDLPFLFESREHAYKVLDGPIGKDLLSAFTDKGIKGLAFWENGFRNITNSVRPIEKPEDLKGIKIRTMENKIHLASFKAWGASSTPMAFPEVYSALQQKTIDAQENPIAVIYTSKLNEVQKFLSLTGHFYSPALLLMSASAYRSLPEDIRKVFDETAVECGAYERDLLRETEQKQIDELKAKGMQVNSPSKKPFQEAAKSVYEEFESQFGKEVIERIKAAK